MEQQATLAYRLWPDRRRRARDLRSRYPFAEDVLRLYSAILEVQERAWDESATAGPDANGLNAFVKERVLPGVVEATISEGPEQLRGQVISRLHSADLEELLQRWLRSKEQPAVDRFLARAALTPVLEARPDLRRLCTGPRDTRHCPDCGGLPQVSHLSQSGEALVSAPRQLICSRCETGWSHPRLVCVACGEQSATQLRVLEEEAEGTFPHLRLEACDTCRRYLVSVDLRRDAQAVPVVDEVAATPLHLLARDQGLSRIVTNLMGF